MAEEEVIKVESKPKKSKKGLIIGAVILFVLLLVLLGGVYVLFRMGVLGDLMAERERPAQQPHTAAAEGVTPDYMYEMPEILVNLEGEGPRSQFLSIKFFVGFNDARLEEKLEQRTPEIRDRVLKVLWGVEKDEVLTVEGKESLREDLHRTIDEMFYEDDILGIYFWHVMIQ